MRVRGDPISSASPSASSMLDTRFPRIPGDIGQRRDLRLPRALPPRDAAPPPTAWCAGPTRICCPRFLRARASSSARASRAITTSCGFLAKFQARAGLGGVRARLHVEPDAGAAGPPHAGARAARWASSPWTPPRSGPPHYAGAGIGPDMPDRGGRARDGEGVHARDARRHAGAGRRRRAGRARERGAAPRGRASRRSAPSCSSAPTCRRIRADIQHATGLPVFDITTLVRMVHDAVRHGLPPRPA